MEDAGGEMGQDPLSLWCTWQEKCPGNLERGLGARDPVPASEPLNEGSSESDPPLLPNLLLLPRAQQSPNWVGLLSPTQCLKYVYI